MTLESDFADETSDHPVCRYPHGLLHLEVGSDHGYWHGSCRCADQASEGGRCWRTCRPYTVLAMRVRREQGLVQLECIAASTLVGLGATNLRSRSSLSLRSMVMTACNPIAAEDKDDK